MSEVKTIAKGAVWNFTSVMANRLIAVVYLVLLTRSFPQEIIGDFYLALSLFGLLTIFTDFGIVDSIQRYIPYFSGRKEFSKLHALVSLSFKAALFFGITFTLLLYLFSQQFAMLFGNANLILLFQLMAVYVLLYELFRLSNSLLISRTRMRESAIANILQNFGKLVFTALFLLLWGPSYFTIAASFLASYAIPIIYSFFSSMRDLSQIPAAKAEAKGQTAALLREVVPFGLTMVVVSSFSLVLQYIDRVMLGYFLPTSEASAAIAVYTVASSLAFVIGMGASSLVGIFLPVIAEKIGRDDRKEELIDITNIGVKWATLSLVPFLFVFLLFPSELLGAVYGASYSAGWPILIIFTIGLFISYMLSVPRTVISGLRKIDIELKLLFIAAVLVLGGDVLLIPIYGAQGAAIASCTSLIISALIGTIYANRLFGYRPKPELLKIIATGALVLLVLFLCRQLFLGFYQIDLVKLPADADILLRTANKFIKLAQLSLPFIFGSALFALALVLLRVFDKHDVEVFKAAMRKAGMPSHYSEKIASLLVDKS